MSVSLNKSKNQSNIKEKEQLGFWRKRGRDFVPKSTEDSVKSFWEKLVFIKESLTKKRESRIETFEQAQTRLNVSNTDIKAVEKNYIILAWLMTFFGVVCFGQAVYQLFFGASLMKGFASAVFLFYFSVMTFHYSFRVFQIRKRKLCSLREFLDSGEFIPRKLNQK